MVQHDHADRKSTRLNSSHLVISYAVFCLKKNHQRERRLGGKGHRHLPGVLGAFAQPIPAERDSPLHLEEQRARRLAARRAQHDVRDGVAVGYALEGTDRLLEIEGSLVAGGRMRGSGDVVPRDGGQRRLRSIRRLPRGCRELDRLRGWGGGGGGLLGFLNREGVPRLPLPWGCVGGG